jgi:hypothetical protein
LARATAVLTELSKNPAATPMPVPDVTNTHRSGDRMIPTAPREATVPASMIIRLMPSRPSSRPATDELAMAPKVATSSTMPRSSSGAWKPRLTAGHAVPIMPSGSPRATKEYMARASNALACPDSVTGGPAWPRPWSWLSARRLTREAN